MSSSSDLLFLTGDRDQRISWVVRRSLFFFPATLVAITVAALLLPPLSIEGTAERLAFALRWIFIALLPFIMVWITILTVRLREGSHDPLMGAESHRLQVHCRMMQNTLEQFVILSVSLLAAASTLSAHHLQLIPTLCTAFVVARLVYWKGYLHPTNCLARSTGTQITSAINTLAIGAAALGFSSGF